MACRWKMVISIDCGKFRREMLRKKPPDFVNNEINGKIGTKHMEICSRKENTFSLTVWYLNGEIIIVNAVS